MHSVIMSAMQCNRRRTSRCVYMLYISPRLDPKRGPLS